MIPNARKTIEDPILMYLSGSKFFSLAPIMTAMTVIRRKAEPIPIKTNTGDENLAPRAMVAS